MLVECTVHIGGARLITIRQLASLVQLFLLKAEDFSLAFLSSSTSTYRISRSQPYRVCQTWLLEGAERAGRTRRVDLLRGRCRLSGGARRAPFYARSYANEVMSPAVPLNSFTPRLRKGVQRPVGPPSPTPTSPSTRALEPHRWRN